MLMLMDKSDESDDIQGARQLQPGKFWVIHLLVEADFNLMVGICFGRQAMYQPCKRNSLIYTGQGARIDGECESVAFTKVLHITIPWVSSSLAKLSGQD
jgi:hypothetical protein